MSRLPLLVGAGLALVAHLFSQAVPAGLPAISFEDALERARANSPQFLSAQIEAKLAREDHLQARAALLPSVNWLNQFIYTQPNGSGSGVFVSNDGPHVYNNQAILHGEIYSPPKAAQYRMSLAAEAAALARAEVAARGLTLAVTERYYGLVLAGRRGAHARRSLEEAGLFLSITQKQEAGGEVAHADVVKAEMQRDQRQREAQDAELALAKARLGLAVLLFRDFRQDFSVVDDLDEPRPLPPKEELQALAGRNNPDIRAAQETVRRETFGIRAARGERLPTLSFEYVYGINANQYAVRGPEQLRNLGSSVMAELAVPVFNWGASGSRVRQAELRLQQAQAELSLAQRGLLANLNAFYLEADAAGMQRASLRHSSDLAAESARLTLLGYQAGEATALEVVDAQAALIQARNAADEGLLRYRLALVNLQTLTGAF
ncbi:MAG: TolC family protein [Bryobacterales bacterium]|nr:TolC family protein [Bryobacterales bacterium]